MAKAKKKAVRKRLKPEPIRFVFASDDDFHNYLIPADQKETFNEWLEAGPYWDGYEGEHFDIYRIDSLFEYTFTDPRSDC